MAVSTRPPKKWCAQGGWWYPHYPDSGDVQASLVGWKNRDRPRPVRALASPKIYDWLIYEQAKWDVYQDYLEGRERVKARREREAKLPETRGKKAW